MRKIKSLRPFFVDTWDRHKKVLIITASAIVAFIGCLLVALFIPAEPAKAAQEEADVPVSGIPGAELLTDEAEAEKRDEMAKRMEEIYDYLVQLDTMVTDNQTTLETVRQQTDAELKGDEEVSEVQEKLEGDVVHLGTRMSDLHEEITNTKELILLLKDSTEKGQQTGRDATVQSFTQVEESVKNIGHNVEEAISDVSGLIDRFRSDDAARHQTVIDTLSTMKTTMQTAQTESFTAMNEKLSGMKEEYLNTMSRMQETLNSELTETRNSLTDNIGQMDQHIGNQFENMRGSMDSGFGALSSTVGERFDSVQGSMNSGFGSLNEAMGERFEATDSRLQTGLEGLNTSMNSGLTTLGNSFTTNITSLSNSLTGKDQEIIAMLQGYQSSVDTYLSGADASFRSVADGKKLLANTLATKGKTVGDTATFSEIAAAISELEQTITIENIPNVGITYTYHHHSPESITGADNSDRGAMTYENSHIHDVQGGCFTEPVLHHHTGSCHSYTYGTCGGEIDWDRSDRDWNGELYTIGYCSVCGQEYGDWGYLFDEYVECDKIRVVRDDIICGYSEGQTIGYRCNCGMSDGEIVSATVVFH